MAFKVGSDDVAALYVGTILVDATYFGAILVYEPEGDE